MSVWISDEKLLIFASLISPSKMILFEKKYQTFDTVFHHQMKHLEVRQKYSAARRTLFSVFHLVMKHCVSCLIYYKKYLSQENEKQNYFIRVNQYYYCWQSSASHSPQNKDKNKELK